MVIFLRQQPVAIVVPVKIGAAPVNPACRSRQAAIHTGIQRHHVHDLRIEAKLPVAALASGVVEEYLVSAMTLKAFHGRGRGRFMTRAWD